jgi:hypothetical protein
VIPRLKIRGIYSTALTRFSLDSGYKIVDPSSTIRERFDVGFLDGDYDILIQDRDDLQGIVLRGEADQLCSLLAGMQETFLDAIIEKFAPEAEGRTIVSANLELPGGSKEKMDRMREGVVPTLKNHHRMKIIAPELLKAAEAELEEDPASRPKLERKLLNDCILMPIVREGVVRLEHVRPSGKSMRPRQGIVEEAGDHRIVFKRSFSEGRYDGLELPIHKGDYCLTELREGEWYIKHRYFSGDHQLIGEYYNINTPVEFYPYGARYVDLEVDVIRRAGEDAFVIDREKLEILAQKGCISTDLEARALVIAEQMLRKLFSESNELTGA